MAISFGSGAVKPYVGGSEIQEAYVGSQLVYQSKPPYTYVFLGGESKYYLADYASLQNGCAIAKESGVYRLSYPAKTSDIAEINITQINGTHLKFIYKMASASSTSIFRVYGYRNGAWFSIKDFYQTADYTLADVEVGNYTQLSLRFSGYTMGYADSVRFENA